MGAGARLLGAMISVAAFYHFADLADPAALRTPLVALAQSHGLRGSVLIAPEGVNGTIAGPAGGVDAALAHMRAWPGCRPLRAQRSSAGQMPFGRLKVRLKREIVTLGRPDIRPACGTGVRVAPAEWNALITAPDVALIDTRNAYETRIGTFRGAIDPRLERFGDFPAWWAAHGPRLANRRIAMFCTGGIRCEKSTALLRAEGVREVYHLDGGILSYLARVPERDSLWQGECFVFDRRVALNHGLRPGRAVMCHACRHPVPADATGTAGYEEGVSCPACLDCFTAADRARFRERHRQIRLAAARGARHLA